MKNNILIFGDSIPYGVGDEIDKKDDNGNEGKGGWSTRLRNKFESGKTGNNINNYFHNFEIPGAKTSDIVVLFEDMCKHFIYDGVNNIIIFSIGINDTQFNGVIPSPDTLQLFESNICKLAKLAKRYTENVLFVGLTRVTQKDDKIPMFWKEGKYYDNHVIDVFDSKLKKICEDYNCDYLLLDFPNATYNPDDPKNSKVKISDDGLHPSPTGHETISRKVEDLIRERYIDVAKEHMEVEF